MRIKYTILSGSGFIISFKLFKKFDMKIVFPHPVGPDI